MKPTSLILLIAIPSFTFFSCKNGDRTEEEVQRARQATLDSVNMANGRQRVMDSLSAISHSVPDAVVLETPTYVAEPETKHHDTKHHPTRSTQPATNPTVASGGGGSSAPTNTGTAQQGTTATNDGTVAGTEEAKKKKGLNNAAKGAIIGLGTGAAAGAVLNKENRGKGAVIGGVVGAVGGAVGGAVLDKRKAKKEAEKDSTQKK